MALIAPVNLPFNVKTLWFDPSGLDIHAGDHVVVRTARGVELGVAAQDVIEVSDESLEKLKSPLKPVLRIASIEDIEKAAEMEELGREAMPIFKELARETSEDMHPVSVEYLLEGDKAIFYFEAEERIDFRELVRKLASHFHVRIDMHQIGVRDEARIIGGIAHCGQEVCCKRLGGEFKPVSIRMAKDQDLSLNPQKISGLCGRLMCCLRYEIDAYKDFKGRAPKMGAVIHTPAGDAKVIDLDVPKEIVTIKIEDEKPLKVNLSDFTIEEEGVRPDTIDEEGWERANETPEIIGFESSGLFSTSQFTGTDKLGSAKAVHHESAERSNRKSVSSKSNKSSSGEDKHRTKRRRSTTIKGSEKRTEENVQTASKDPGKKQDQARSKPASKAKIRPGQKSSGLSQGRSQSNKSKPERQKKQQDSRNSTAERSKQQNTSNDQKQSANNQGRKRRRSHNVNNKPKGE